MPLSNDIFDWQRLDPHERTLTMRVFAGLTMLDTVQATVGEICQIADARTEHEEAVYTNIAFMQSVHARSYSSVFSTLASTPEIDDAYRWAMDNDPAAAAGPGGLLPGGAGRDAHVHRRAVRARAHLLGRAV